MHSSVRLMACCAFASTDASDRVVAAVASGNMEWALVAARQARQCAVRCEKAVDDYIEQKELADIFNEAQEGECEEKEDETPQEPLHDSSFSCCKRRRKE